jgi:hypothetical protein
MQLWPAVALNTNEDSSLWLEMHTCNLYAYPATTQRTACCHEPAVLQGRGVWDGVTVLMMFIPDEPSGGYYLGHHPPSTPHADLQYDNKLAITPCSMLPVLCVCMQANTPDASNAIYYIHISCPAPTSTVVAPDCVAIQWFVGNNSLPYYDNTTLATLGAVGGRKLLGGTFEEEVRETQLVSMIRGSGVHQPGRAALAVTAALLDVPEQQLPTGSSQGVTSSSSNWRRLLAEDLSLTGSHQSRQLQAASLPASGTSSGTGRRRSTRRRLDENGRPVPLTLQQLAENSGVTDMTDPVQLAHFLHKHR